MSFVRINRRPIRTKKASAPKKEWVSTVTDLSVHKPTAEELSRRHELNKSRNKAAAQWELREKTLKMRKTCSASPPGLDRTRLRLFREMFSDQCQLHDVLARSDRALAAVKDLFGDAPCRQTGFPSVTMAPGCESDSDLPVLQKPDPPTQLSLLSQSMMGREALNELDDSVGESAVQDQDDSISFNTELPRPKRKTCKAKPPAWATERRQQQQNLPQTPTNPATSSEELAALNATVAVQRLKSRPSQPEADQSTTLFTQVLNPAASHSGVKNRPCRTTRRPRSEAQLNASGFSSGNQSSLELLQDMLGQVESELDGLDPPKMPGSPEQPELHCDRGLTGFSVALVNTLGRIATHLRRKEEEAQKELQLRGRMEEELRAHRNLIDALTAECLALREESAALQANLQGRVTELEQRLDMVILTAGEMENDGNAPGEFEEEPVPDVHMKPRPAETDRPAAPAAVMLSPPRQRDTKAPPAGRTRSLHFEGSDTPGSGSAAESDISCSPSSFASLPESVLPRTARFLPQPRQDTLLDQIAVLTNQNTAMQNRMGQYCTPFSGSSETKEHENVSPPAGRQTTQQCVRADDSSLKLMEDRLQELNRQSAAARAKLLELIEQQKNSSSQSASPAISPIPSHSISPPTVSVRRTPEVCVSVPERDRPSPTSTNSRSSAEVVSPHTTGLRRSSNSPVDKLRGEGWFALSAHV